MGLSETSLPDFTNVRDFLGSNDNSLYCSIKSNLSIRMKECKLFALIAGKSTASITKGKCSLHRECSSVYETRRYCSVGNSLSHKSYIEYECDLAIRGNLRIVVLYNAGSVGKNLCPDALRGKGIKKYGSFEYFLVEDAFLKILC